MIISTFLLLKILTFPRKMSETMVNLSDLPELLISHILSLTTPKDVLQASLVSKKFLSASKFDSVWNKFLPPGFEDFSQQFSFKKDLFVHVCTSHVLINDNTQSLSLQKWSGKKCYMLGAKALTIVKSRPECWSWKPLPESRFPEVAALEIDDSIDIKGKIETKLLSPGTTYGAYFVYKIEDNGPYITGFEMTPVYVSVFEVDELKEVDKDQDDDGFSRRCISMIYYLMPPDDEVMKKQLERISMGVFADRRNDGWLEVKMDQFKVEDNESKVLEMAFWETECRNWKYGLVVEGIELRPLD